MTGRAQVKDIGDLRFLYDLSIYNCQKYGPFKSLIYEDGEEVQEYTNVEIAKEATQLAVGLRRLGIEKGDRIIVMMLNCPEVIISYQAIARAGAIIIPVLPLLKGPEVHYIAENSAAKAVITNPIFLPLLRNALADVPTMRHIISTDRESEERDESGTYTVRAYKDVITRGAAFADHYLEDLEEVSLTPDEPAAILYTSGTTGHPKGVVLTHRNVVSNAASSRSVEEGTPSIHEVHLAVLPLAHAYGLVASNVGYLTGVVAVLHPRFDTTAVLSAIERYRVNTFAGVPAMFVALLYSPDTDKFDTGSLRYCVSGSAPLPLAILEGFEQKFGCPILEGYGLSEASAVLTGHSQDMPRKPGSVGKPISGVEILIVDANDKPLPVGEIGEVIARGPNIMQGYYHMPDETRVTLRNGWLHTGDMGRFDADGYLYIVERKKDLIIRGGFNIYPRDIEEILNRHPAVIESAVVGIPSERMGEEVKAFVVTRTDVDSETLKAYCRKSLANYKTPSEIEFVSALPRNAVGKIDKKELRRSHVH
jgi:long-chain acyl-CoA synthetase